MSPEHLFIAVLQLILNALYFIKKFNSGIEILKQTLNCVLLEQLKFCTYFSKVIFKKVRLMDGFISILFFVKFQIFIY